MRHPGRGRVRVARDDQGRRRSGIDRDALGARDGPGPRVGGRDGLRAGRLERGPVGEGVRPGVTGREGVVARQDRPAVAAGEVHRAPVGGGHVAEGVLGRDRDVVRRPGRGRVRVARDHELGGRPDVHRDPALGARDGPGHRVGGRDRLGAGRLERGAVGEGVRPGVPGREGVVARQDRLAVAAGEVDRARVGAGHVPGGVLGRDRDVVRHPGRGRVRVARDHELGRRPDVHRDALGARDGPGHRVGGRDRLGARCLERDPVGEGVRPGVTGREGVVARQDRPAVAAGEVHRAPVGAGHVAEGVLGRDRDVVRRPRRGRVRVARDDQGRRRSGIDRDALGARDGPGHRVGGRDGLGAGRLEGDPVGEGVRPGVPGREGVVARQDRLAVAAGEVHRARVGAGHVAGGVLGRDRDVVRHPGRGRVRVARDHELGGRPDVHRDPALGARDGPGHRVGGRDGLGARLS